MVSRCAAVMLAAAALADVAQPLPLDLHALDGDASEMPECSVSLLQTRMERMRKSQVSVEAGDSMNVNNQVEGAVQASEAMQEMGEAFTDLFSLSNGQLDRPREAEAIKARATLQSTAIGKASHAIEDVKQAFSKLLAQEKARAKAGKEQIGKKDSKKQDDLSFTQSKDARAGHSSTFDLESAADFWNDADVSTAASNGISTKEDSGANVDIWDDDWKTASKAGSLDVTQSATEASYLSQSHFVQAALEGNHADSKSEVGDKTIQKVVDAKSEADGRTKQKVVLTWGADKEPPKNSLLSAKTAGVPLTMAKEQAEDDETISSKKFETSDEQVVKAFIGGNVAQNSKSVQSILGDMMLSPDDQGMFGAPREETNSKSGKKHHEVVAQNRSSLAADNQNKSEAQNQTVLAATEQGESDAPNKTSLATVGSAIKSVIKSVENSSWPWSKPAKADETKGEVLAKDVSNSTKEFSQDLSRANQSVEIKTSANGTGQSDDNATKEDATNSSAKKTESEKSDNTVPKENATGAVLESSNKTAHEDIASGTKSNKTSEAKISMNDTNSIDKK